MEACKCSIYDAQSDTWLANNVPATRHTARIGDHDTLFVTVVSKALPDLYLGRTYLIEVDGTEMAPFLMERKQRGASGEVEVVFRIVGDSVRR